LCCIIFPASCGPITIDRTMWMETLESTIMILLYCIAMCQLHGPGITSSRCLETRLEMEKTGERLNIFMHKTNKLPGKNDGKLEHCST
jgi:hypothetical protein